MSNISNTTTNNNSNFTDTNSMNFFSNEIIFFTQIMYSTIFVVGFLANTIVGVSQMLRRWTSVGVYTFNLAVSLGLGISDY